MWTHMRSSGQISSLLTLLSVPGSQFLLLIGKSHVVLVLSLLAMDLPLGKDTNDTRSLFRVCFLCVFLKTEQTLLPVIITVLLLNEGAYASEKHSLAWGLTTESP